MVLTDTHNRVHNYLRLSLTDQCNLRCNYCLPDEKINWLPSQKMMTANEVFAIAKTFVQLGVNKIRLTGGEPLVRKDFSDILQLLSTLNVEITLTTNATLLHQYFDALKLAGVKSLNISLDTLDANKFKEITKRKSFDRVLENIQLSLAHGFITKVNMVVMKNQNHQEIIDFVKLTQNQALHVRFIEFMPFSGNNWQSNLVYTESEMLADITSQFECTALPTPPNATAIPYQIKNALGTFGIIASMSKPFCGTCNRIRVTADGKIKNCLFAKNEFDLLQTLRNNGNLETIIKEALFHKHAKLGGQFDADFRQVQPQLLTNRSMIKIGG